MIVIIVVSGICVRIVVISIVSAAHSFLLLM